MRAFDSDVRPPHKDLLFLELPVFVRFNPLDTLGCATMEGFLKVKLQEEGLSLSQLAGKRARNQPPGDWWEVVTSTISQSLP